MNISKKNQKTLYIIILSLIALILVLIILLAYQLFNGSSDQGTANQMHNNTPTNNTTLEVTPTKSTNYIDFNQRSQNAKKKFHDAIKKAFNENQADIVDDIWDTSVLVGDDFIYLQFIEYSEYDSFSQNIILISMIKCLTDEFNIDMDELLNDNSELNSSGSTSEVNWECSTKTEKDGDISTVFSIKRK